jgi:DNA invertase Pin-like site-specific DNA recombinase
LEISKHAIENKINLFIAKQNLIFDDSIQSKIYTTILGLVAEIERDFIQQRTKTALDKRKSEIKEKGFFISKSGNKRNQLGNAKGTKYKLALDDKKEEIHNLFNLGVSKSAICKIVKTTYPTLKLFLERNPPDGQMSILK